MNFRLLFQLIGYCIFIALGHGLIYLFIEMDTSDLGPDPHAGIGKGLAFFYFNFWFLILLLIGSLIKLIVHVRSPNASASMMGYLYFPMTLMYAFVLFSLYMAM